MITCVILLSAKFGLMLWNNNFRVIIGNHYGTYHIFLFVYAVSLFCFCFFISFRVIFVLLVYYMTMIITVTIFS